MPLKSSCTRAAKVSVLVGLLACTLPCRAADTVIGFDDQSAGTAINAQYHASGVDLDMRAGGCAGEFPVVVAGVGAASAPNMLDASGRCPVEFPSAYLQGVFVDPHHHHVALKIHGRGFQGNAQTGTTTLTAFDLSGKIVATATGVAPPPPGNDFLLLDAISSGADIARFQILCYNDLLYVDDLAFDTIVGTPAPDFSLYGVATQIAAGGSVDTPAVVRRFNGSSGDVLLSVSNLPPGVVVAGINPDPVNGPDGASATITLSATPQATPVQDWPVLISGLPSPSAGQYGTHSATFPLTILDSYDAQIVGIEVTQGVQPYQLASASNGNNPLHGTPVRYSGLALAAGGRTAVRVFPDLARFPQVTAPPDYLCTLEATRDGVALAGGPLVSAAGPGGLILGPNFVSDLMRARPNGICNFVLPPDWTHGTITLVARLQFIPSLFGPPPAVDCCADNDSFTLTDIPFAPTRDLFFAPFALRVNGGALGYPDDVFAEAQNLLPIGERQFNMGDYVGDIDVTDIWNQDVKACGILGLDSCPEDSTGRGQSVASRLRDIADDMNFTDSGELVVGIFPQADPVGGQSDRIRSWQSTACTGPFWDCDDLSVMAVQNQLRPLTSVAHELGHMLGRPHASLDCGAGDIDNNGAAEHWPPDEHGFIEGVGVDRRDFHVLFPDRTGGNLGGPYYDFMSYCATTKNDDNDPAAWISTRGWNETLQAVATGAPGSSARRLAARRDGAQTKVLVVQAFVDAQGRAFVTKIRNDVRAPSAADPASPYSLRVLDRSGRALAETPMTVESGHGHPGGHNDFLSATVAAHAADAIEIRRNGELIARRERAPHGPRVRDVDVRPLHAGDGDCDDDKAAKVGGRHHCADEHPRPAATRISWRTEHGSARPLTVKIDYSHDAGKTWRPVYFGRDRSPVTLSDTLLAFTPDARVRVRVSDGFNESEAMSHVFHARGAPPQVLINSPAPASHFHAGESIAFSARAYDDRRARLDDGAFTWLLAGKTIGEGATANLASLPAGAHRIVVRAHDKHGRTAQRSVEVTIDP